MSVFIYQENAKAKIAEVEGERWLEETDRNGKYGFNAFLAEYREMEACTTPEARKILEHECLTCRDTPSIYGLGGWHRYLVRYDGEIFFSAYHATPDSLAKAIEAGFRRG